MEDNEDGESGKEEVNLGKLQFSLDYDFQKSEVSMDNLIMLENDINKTIVMFMLVGYDLVVALSLGTNLSLSVSQTLLRCSFVHSSNSKLHPPCISHSSNSKRHPRWSSYSPKAKHHAPWPSRSLSFGPRPDSTIAAILSM